MAHTELSCPHCGLVRAAAPGENEVQLCPRCLARSGGALSVFLAAPTPQRGRSARLVAGRLLRLGRGVGQWART
ncbi:MAG TPA: hypothetical protein VGD00_10330 [Solirubrobacteraceae bacterium]|jgi:hypothetical protein